MNNLPPGFDPGVCLVWTKEPPTEPGWYWKGTLRKGNLSAEIVEVGHTRSGLQYWDGHEDWMILKFNADLWAGPIPVPTEPGEGEK